MSKQLLPATINLTQKDGNAILKGADWSIDISIEEQSNGVTTPIDLTGFTGICQIRESAASNTLIASPTLSIVDPELGAITLSLDASITKTIPTSGKTYREKTVYQYDAYLTNNDLGETARILQGYIEVSPQVSKEEVV